MSYGLPQRCALIVLATKGGEAANNGLGFKLDKGSRDRLENDGLITVDRRVKPMTLRLTDRGWKGFEDEMVAEPPPRSGSAGPALYAVLHAIARVFGDQSVREVFRQPSHQSSSLGAQGQATEKEEADTASSHVSVTVGDDVEDRVLAAYRLLATKQRDWVELEDLRDALSSFSREDVDSALMRMLHARSIELTAHEYRDRLTKSQRDAALQVGRAKMHLVSVRD